jgi:hypothetical protein
MSRSTPRLLTNTVRHCLPCPRPLSLTTTEVAEIKIRPMQASSWICKQSRKAKHCYKQPCLAWCHAHGTLSARYLGTSGATHFANPRGMRHHSTATCYDILWCSTSSTQTHTVPTSYKPAAASNNSMHCIVWTRGQVVHRMGGVGQGRNGKNGAPYCMPALLPTTQHTQQLSTPTRHPKSQCALAVSRTHTSGQGDRTTYCPTTSR